MKKISFLLIATTLLLAACKEDIPKDSILFSGRIVNKNSDSLIITAKSGYKKVVKIKPDGTFTDTLRSSASSFNIHDGKEYAYLFAKIGDEIEMNFNAKNFNKSIVFSGKNAAASNFKAKLILKQDSLIKNDSIFKLNDIEFKKKIAIIREDFNKTIDVTQELDSLFIKDQKEGFDGFLIYLDKIHREKNRIEKKLAKGMPSPQFSDYENYNGGTSSLEDFKGKYVFIDLWATWCEPCKYEMPYLKQAQNAYRDNIEFISISMDNKNERDKWLAMIKEYNLTGVQLFAKGDTKFIKEYKVTSIPRFILLDTNGVIITPDAPKPSDKKLIAIFDDLYKNASDNVQ